MLKPRLEKGSHPEYWVKKIARNIERDLEIDKKLLALDWTVIHFWGKEILSDPGRCVSVIEENIFENMLKEPDSDEKS